MLEFSQDTPGMELSDGVLTIRERLHRYITTICFVVEEIVPHYISKFFDSIRVTVA